MTAKSSAVWTLLVAGLFFGWPKVRGAEWEGRIHDSPSGYPDVKGDELPNRGEGFGPWKVFVSENGSAGIFLADAPGGGGRLPGGSKVFGLFSNPPEKGAEVSVERMFRRKLKPGEAVNLTLWMEWGGGWSTSSKGVELVDEAGNTLVRVVQREASDIFIGQHVAICPQGGAPIHVSFLGRGPDWVEVRARQDNGDDFSGAFQVSSAPAGLRFFSRSIVANNHDKRQLYFGDISVGGAVDGEWDFTAERKPVVRRLEGAVTQSPGFGWAAFLWAGVLGGAAGGGASRLRVGKEGRWFAFFFCAMAGLLVAPVWEATYLPLGDAGAHYRQVSLFAGWPDNSDEYERDLGTPYLAGAGIGGTIAKFTGADFGYRLTLTLSLLGLPVGCLALLKVLGLSRWLVWGSFPFAWNYAHIWGFHGFTAAVVPGMAMLCLAACFTLGKAGPWFAGALALSSAAGALSHAMGWGMFAIVGGAVMVGVARDGISWRTRVSGLACLFLPGLLAVGTGGFAGGLQQEISTMLARDCSPLNLSIGRIGDRAMEMLAYSYGRPSTLAYATIGAFLLAWPVLGGVRLRRAAGALLPALAVVLFFALAPNWAFGVWIVYPRIGFLLLPASYFSFLGGGGGARWFVACGAGLAVAALALAENRSFVNSTRDDGERLSAIVRRIPPGKNVLMILERRGENMFGERNWNESGTLPPAWVHVGGWLQDRTGSNFFPDLIDHGNHFVMRRRGGSGGVLKPDGWWAHSWCPANLMAYDYFLVKTGGGMEYDYLGVESGRVIKLHEAGSWILYGNLRVR